MKHTLFATAALALLLAGCNRQAESEATAAGTATPAAQAPTQAPIPPDAVADPTAGTDAIAVIDHGSPAGDGVAFDTKAFAGTFGTEGTSLAIDADGRYTLTVRAESADADLTSSGTWTVEADGRELLLDPEGKSEPDRRFEIVSNDRLRAVEGGQLLDRN